MKNVSAGFITMLQNSEYLIEADLYTITLASGTVLYYTSAQQNITYNGHTYLAASLDSAPGFVRGTTKCSVGLQSDDLEVDILFDSTTQLSGENPAAFVAAGGLDNAVLRLDKALAPDWSNPVVNGVVNLFCGFVGEAKIEPGKIALTVNSRLKVLNTSFPRNYFLPQCNHALFDTGCALLASTYQVSGTVVAGSSLTGFTSNRTEADGYFALGSITWTSGANTGQKCFVKSYSHTSGTFTLAYPLGATPSAGDTFTALPGCDKTQTTCSSKFSNLAHFRGYPYVPAPSTLEMGQAGSPPSSIGGGGGAGMGSLGRGAGGQAGRLVQR